MSAQDWEPVIIRKHPPRAGADQTVAAVTAARRQGAEVETTKKFNAGANKPAGQGAGAPTTSGKSAVKMDAETEDFHHDKVSSELKKQIVAGRTAKKLTQAQLAQLVNERASVIQEYESGKAIPNPQVLAKLSRVLGVPLRK